MLVSRRAFVHSVGGGTVSIPSLIALVHGRGMGYCEGPDDSVSLPAAPDPELVRIDQNENPVGPGPRAVEALIGALPYAGRYPTNSRPAAKEVTAELARMFSAKPENFVLGAGSSEILRNIERVYLSPTRAYVAGSPSYDKVERFAAQLGAPLRLVPQDEAGGHDMPKIIAAARGAGLVYINSPNNPTATIIPFSAMTELVTDVQKNSPDTGILIDEAYHDYVTDPSYRTSIPLALKYPNVIVCRTMSKAHGMAGLRLGYAVGQAKTIEALGRLAITYNANVLVVAAGVASLRDPAYIDREVARNKEVRSFVMGFFKQAGYRPFESQGNFMFVDVRQPTKVFREECAKLKVEVGRPFAPMDKTHVRISFGTLDEMRRAANVFGKVLNVPAPAASKG